MAHSESNLVAIGTWVKVIEHETGDTEVYHLVENRETDYLQNKISPENPVGGACLAPKRAKKSASMARMAKSRFRFLKLVNTNIGNNIRNR